MYGFKTKIVDKFSLRLLRESKKQENHQLFKQIKDYYVTRMFHENLVFLKHFWKMLPIHEIFLINFYKVFLFSAYYYLNQVDTSYQGDFLQYITGLVF